jgi:hypothetical protein
MARIDFVTGAPEKYAHLVDALSTIPDRLDQVVAGHSDADLRRAPQAAAEGDPWSAHRALGHMAFHCDAYRVFIHQMATMSDPARKPFPGGVEDDALLEGSPAQLVERIRADIAGTVAFLSRTPDASWGRPGFVNGAKRSLRQQVQMHITHLEAHIAQIAQAVAAPSAAAL